MSLLIKTLLSVDPSRRPNINQILKFPLLSEKIPTFLDDGLFKDEFSHTIIHNRKFFDAKGNPIKDPTPLQPIAEEDPTQQQYNNYVGYIKKCIEKDTADDYRDKNVMQGVSGSGSGDREDEEEEETKSEPRSSVASTDSYNFDEVDFGKFSAFMIGKFGQSAFDVGYPIM